MESAEGLKKIEFSHQERGLALEHWLRADCGLEVVSLVPMAGDASFRQYFRLRTQTESFVIMDAPPPRENGRPFVAVAKTLKNAGLMVPTIFHADVEQGFLQLTDFGDATYLKSLTAQNADDLYTRALTALSVMQNCRQVENHTVPAFTREFMQQEWSWHKEWFLEKLLALDFHLTEAELDQCFTQLVESAASQPQVFMHRDYHSANLMVLPDHQVGILDFQDAFIGPLTYDLVSLLRDCYIDWPEDRVNQWALIYWQKMRDANVCIVDQKEFLRWFDWMGLERHLKALFTFARKHVRDHQSHYLHSVPRTLNYIVTISSRYPELIPLHRYYAEIVTPAFNRMMTSCAQ